MRRLSIVFIIPACALASLVLLLALFSTAPVDAFPASADQPAQDSVRAAAAEDQPSSTLPKSKSQPSSFSEADRPALAEARIAAMEPNAPAATLEVQVNYAWDWVAGVTDAWATVVVTVTNGAGDLKADGEVSADESGDFFVGCSDWWSGECPDIVPGDIVKVYAEGLIHEINPVGAIPGELNAANNTVTGWLHADWFAGPLDVSCEIWEESGPLIYTTATTNDGEFQCDFTGTWDLEPFQTVAVRYYEPIGDGGDQVINILQWPWVQVNYGHDWVGATYYLGHTFWLTVTDDADNVKATAMAETEPNGGWGGDGFQTQDWQWDPEQPDIIPGDSVQYQADDGYSNVVEVGDIDAILDISADTVGGTILAPFGISLTVECHPWGAWDVGMGAVPAKQDLVYPDGADPFLCDWGSGGEWDILPGQDIGVIYVEPDGDNVVNVVREPAAYLRINKTSDGQPGEGGNFLYHISYQNDGDAPAENVQIVDTMVGGVSYLSDTSGLSPTGGGTGPITWDIGTVNPGQGGQFDLFVELSAGTGEWFSNTAEISTSSYNQAQPWETEGYAENQVLANDTHLNVGKWAWTGDPAPDFEFVFGVGVCNNGSTGSSEVTLVDNLQHPAMALQGWWGDTSGWYEVTSDSGHLEVAIPSIPSNSCRNVYLRVFLDPAAVGPGDSLDNQAIISAANDLETDDNETWWGGSAGSPHANISVDKSWHWGQLYPGGELTYGINLYNSGNVPVGPIAITDTFPVDTTFVNAWYNDLYGGYDFPPTTLGPGYAVWELPGLENGTGGDIEITLAVDEGATPGIELVNWAEISQLPEEDDYEDNADFWSETLNSAGPNLRVRKYFNWNNDSQISYQLQFENIGDVTIYDFWITDTLSAEQTWDGWWDLGFDWSRLVGDIHVDGNTLSWNFNEIYPGDSGWLYFNASVDDPSAPLRPYTNTAEITLPPGDVNPDDNVAEIVAVSGPEVRRVEFWLNPNGDSGMWGEAAPGLVVTVTNPFGTQYNAWADPECGGCWNVDNVGPLIPGDNVVIEAGAGIQPVVATMPFIDVAVDAAADEVIGQIVPWENRPVEVHGNWTGGFRQVPSDGSGNFLASYPDIPRGGSGYVRFIDDIDLAEVIYHRPFYALDLVLNVNYGHDWIEGFYEPGHTIWITATASDGSTVKGVAELTSDYPPNWDQPGFATWWQGWLGDQPNLMPNDWVFAKADTGWTNAVQVGEIDFDVDYGADVVSGILNAPAVGAPLVNLECAIWSQSGGPSLSDMIDPDGGAIYCDFATIPWDIQSGETVAVYYWDEDGDQIINTVDWPQITVNIGPWSGGDRQVWGNRATPDSSVEVTVRDSGGNFLQATTAATDEWGNFDTGESLSEGILALWNVVEVDFGNGITDTVTVYPMSGEANPDTDVVTITAAGPPSFSVQLEVCDDQEGWCNWYDLGDIGESGIIEVDMMADFGFDVRWGQAFHAHMTVWNGHLVRYAWGLPAPELTLSKWHSGNYARPGGVIVYGIQYQNDGNGPAEDVTITEYLTPGLTYAGDTSGVSPDVIDPAGPIVWHLGTVEPGEQRAFMVTLNVDLGMSEGQGAIGENCAEITTSSPGDWNPESNEACAGPTDLWNDEVEIGVDKSAQPWDPAPGQEFEYYIGWCNNRGAAAGPVVMTDTLPAGTTLLDWWPQNWNEVFWNELASSPDELVLYAPGLPGDYCETITLRMLLAPDVEMGANLQNLVVLNVADDVDPDNNWRLHDGAQAGPPRYDMQMDKSFSSGILAPGGYVGFSIDYYNAGNIATTVHISDDLPPGLSYVGGSWADSTPWQDEPFPDPAIIGNQLVWDLPEVPVNRWHGFNIQLHIDAADPIIGLANCATVTGAGVDSAPGDNSDCVSFDINPPGPNLSVSKWHNWNSDGQLGYWINFYNLGDQAVSDAWIADTLPAGTHWNGWWDLDSGWWERLIDDIIVDGDQLMWHFSEINPGEQGWISFQANLEEAGAPLHWYTNTVDITVPEGETTPDDNHAEDTAFSGGEVEWVDLQVYGNNIWGHAPQGPIVITTPYEEDILPWDGDFDWNLDNNLLPGDILTITAGAGLAPVTIVIPDPFDAEASSISDRVWGQVDHLDHEWLTADLYDGPDINTQTDGDGFFDVLFPDIPRAGEGDLNYTTQVDYTSVTFHRHWRSPDLVLEVRLFDYLVEGRYPVGHTVWITVTESDGETVKGTAELSTHYIAPWDDTGFTTNEGWIVDPGQIVPGDWVYARSESGFTSEVRVFDISGLVDVDTDSISGYVDAPWYIGGYDPLDVQCHPWGAWGMGWNDVEVKYSSASADGTTTPYFCQWDPATEWDVDYGQDIGIWVPDDDGDFVVNSFLGEAIELGVWKWNQGNYARPGGVVVYGIYYRNNGSVAAEDVQIVDTLPAFTTYADDTSGLPATIGPGNLVTWDLGTLDVDESGVIWVTLNVASELSEGSGAIEPNCVAITSSTTPDLDPGNDSFCADPVDVWADEVEIGINKWAQPGDPTPGQPFRYEVQWCNNRGAAAGPVVLTDTLPAEVTFLEWREQQEGQQLWRQVSFDGTQLVLYAPGLPGDECQNIDVYVELNSETPIGTWLVNLAELAVEGDVDLNNNWVLHDGAQASPPRYDLGVGKRFHNGSIVPGGWINYMIDYDNNGNAASGVTITETVPPGLSYNGSWWGGDLESEFGPLPAPEIVGDQLVWHLPEIAADNNLWFHVEMIIDESAQPGSEFGNCVEIGGDGPDDRPEDNVACETVVINPPGPNLAVSKQHDWEDSDDHLAYQVTLFNLGDEVAYGVVLTDTYPEGTAAGNWPNWDHWSGNVDVIDDTANNQWIFLIEEIWPGDMSRFFFNVNLNDAGEPMRWYTNTATVAILPGEVNPDDNYAEDLAFSGPEVQYVEVEVYGNHVWGYAPRGPVEISTPRETLSVPDDGDFDWNLEQGFLPGDTVTVTAGAGQAPVIFQIPDSFDALGDSDTDHVLGQIDSLDHAYIEVSLDNGATVPGETDGSGFFDVLLPDIPFGGHGEVRYGEQAGWTDVVYHRSWRTLDLTLEVNYGHDWVEGLYEPGHTFWITVTESDGTNVKGLAVLYSDPIDDWGGQSGFSTNYYGGWLGDPVDLQANDWVFARVDNGRTAEVQLGTIDGALDVDADTVDLTFTVPWFSDPLPARCDLWKPDGPSLQFLVGPSGGTHLCDFTPTGWDLQPGDDVGVSYLGPDGHRVYNVFVEPAPYLHIRKYAQGEAGQGGNLAFRIEYGNWGGATAEDVTISDVLGPGLVYVGDTSGAAHTGSGSGPISWNLGDVDPGYDSFFDVFVEITVGATEPISNAAFITTTNPFNQSDPEDSEAGWEGVVQENDTHVNVGKWAWTEDPAPDQNVVFDVSVCNNGSTGSSELTLTDNLHPDLSLVDWWSNEGGWQEVGSDAQQLVLTRPSIPGQWCSDVMIETHVNAAVQAGDTLSNTATVAAANDIEAEDNEVTWEGQASNAHQNLLIYKWWQRGQLVPGGQLVYHIRVLNTGNVPVGPFVVTDTLPILTTFQESWLYETNGETPLVPAAITSDYVVWAFDGLANGAWIDFDITLVVDPDTPPGTVLVNLAEVTRLPGEDDYDDNVMESVEVLNVPGPNLRVAKWHNWVGPETLQYSLRFENIGTEIVTDFWVTDTLPIGLNWDGWYDTGVDEEDQLDFIATAESLAWLFGEILPGEANGVNFGASLANPEAPAPVYTNTVAITIPPGDVNPDDNFFVDEAVLVTGRLWVEPPLAQLSVGDVFTVEVAVENVADLQGITLQLTFDPALVEVVDADPGTPGVQVVPGDCPAPDSVWINAANNETGVIDYAAVAFSLACNGDGVVMKVAFHALDGGISPVHFTAWTPVDPDGFDIPLGVEDGSIEISSLGLLQGQVELQGRKNHSGAEVCVEDDAGTASCMTTAPTGFFSFWLDTGVYTVTVELAPYLGAEKGNVLVTTGGTTSLAKVKLLGGDVDGNGTINILDIAFMGGRYLSACGDASYDERGDPNADCLIDIRDLAIAGGNYLQTSPVFWP